MAMRKLIVFTVVAFVFAGAQARAESANIRENVDPYTHLRTLLLINVQTGACHGDPASFYTGDLRLAFAAQEEKDHTVTYSLTTEFNGGNSVYVRAKSTMDVLVDGAVGELKTPGGSTINYVPGGTLYETVVYPVSRQQLEALSQAQNFQFRINGQTASVQRCTSAKRMKDLAEFLDAASDYTH
jgi:hypothetical protein